MYFLKLTGNLLLSCVLIVLLHLMVLEGKLRARWLKWYYTKRGIPFYVAHDKFYDVVYRIKK